MSAPDSADQPPPDPATLWMQIFETIQESWRLQLDGMEGMVSEAMRRGFTKDQACAMVAHQFGWRYIEPTPRPPDA